jgi:hypothetical protein
MRAITLEKGLVLSGGNNVPFRHREVSARRSIERVWPL